MTQITLPRSNSSLDHPLDSHLKHQITPQLSGPFLFAPVSPQSDSHTRSVSLSSHWTNSEKERYSIFVSYFRELVREQSDVTRKWEIFRGMSRFIRSRNPQQCRSHHLKLVRQFKGINRFIGMVMERVPRLKEKMECMEEELSEIQMEFNLYLGDENEVKLYSIKENKLFDEEEDNGQEGNQVKCSYMTEKHDKQQLIKTSDSYMQQHPVNSNNNSFSIFSSRSQFKPFPHFKAKVPKSSLPSFNDEPVVANPSIQVGTSFGEQEKPYSQVDVLKELQISAKANQIQQFNEHFKVFSNEFEGHKDQGNNQEKGIEKMKEFLECHYLFQLWTSKLQKIMRDS